MYKLPIELGLAVAWVTAGQKSEKPGWRHPTCSPRGKFSPPAPGVLLPTLDFRGKKKGIP